MDYMKSSIRGHDYSDDHLRNSMLEHQPQSQIQHSFHGINGRDEKGFPYDMNTNYNSVVGKQPHLYL